MLLYIQYIRSPSVRISRATAVMPFELSVLAEAKMDVHSVTVDNDTTVEELFLELTGLMNGITSHNGS